MYKILDNINSPKDLKNLNYFELKTLSVEIRDFLLKNISETGGHLASNLGVVELTIMLHKVFDAPIDKIIWDVGHQGYVHKILTGRKNEFNSLRKLDGLSGFLKISESKYDVFGAGHSSTSLSVASGISKARGLKKENFNIVPVIGDGALTGGMAYEALNNIGHSKEKIIVILNDNEMSIDANIGGVSKYLSKLRTNSKYYAAKNKVHKVLDKANGLGEKIAFSIRRVKDGVKYIFIPGVFFEDLGFTYIGPIDGHNFNELEDALNRANNIDGPSLVHVMTTKGKGYVFAEDNPDLYHGVSVFDLNKGILKKKKLMFSNVLGKFLLDNVDKNDKILAISAAMPSGTGLSEFKNQYPDKYIDVGIAEQHAVTMAGGLAIEGFKPIFAVYSTFLQRAYDQIVHDICIQNLNVVFAIDRAGVVGEDGETHNGVFDIAYLSHIPNITILSPKNGDDLYKMLYYAVYDHIGPIAIRYPRMTTELTIYENCELDLDSKILIDGDDAVIFATGNMVENAVKAADILKGKLINIRVVEVLKIKPLDVDNIIKFAFNYKFIFTVEDHSKIGGLGDCILNALVENEFNIQHFEKIAYPDEFIKHGSIELIHEKYDLSDRGIATKIEKQIKNKDEIWEK